MTELAFKREKLIPPGGVDQVLLHSCCAPCSAEIMEAIISSGIKLTLFFYNPNIHPRIEYEIRKKENIRFAEKKGIEFFDGDYDTDNWFQRVKGLEWEPERGQRCTVCFDMRMERTALFAYEKGFKVFCTSLGISRWKDFDQVTAAGIRAASRYGLTYWTYNWRKKGGSERMILISKAENFYQQLYCGCIYSLRDTNKWRVSRGKPKISFGSTFYGFEGSERSSSPKEGSPG